MITFYGSPMSSASRTHWLLEEAGVPYEYKIVNIREGQQRTPEFLAVNPNGKIPAIVDGDVKIAESMAINFYVAEKYAPALIPSDVVQRAKVLEWSFWVASTVQQPLVNILMHTTFLPEAQRDAALVEKSRAELPRYLEVLEKGLTGHEYLVGDRFTVADVNVASVLGLAIMGKVELGPNTMAWLTRMNARPAFQRAMQA